MGPERFKSDRPSASSEHRAALEALFAPKPATPAPPSAAALKRDSAKMVVARAKPEDGPNAAQREKLLARLLDAQGRATVTKAAEDFARAGFAFPRDQELQLALLEHNEEQRVRDALVILSEILAVEPPKRRTVLESRLKRLEECAEESSTRDLAEKLRRALPAGAGARR